MSRSATIRHLQQQVQRLEGATRARALPSLPGLGEVVRLRVGTVCGLDSPSLAMALMAGPSQAGEWCAVVGAPDFGFEAAAGFGMDLERTIVVPDPGEHWLSVTAGLVDVASLVLVRPPRPVSPSQAERLRSRLRQQDAALLVLGSWPRVQTRLSVAASSWVGLGGGHGRLKARQVQIGVSSATGEQTFSAWLPGPVRPFELLCRPDRPNRSQPEAQAG